MHELTLLMGVADEVGRVTRENDIDHVDAVVLEIGELTAVIPEFLLDGYEVISDDFDYLRGSELIIETIPGAAVCSDCGTEYLLAENEGRCPQCGSCEKSITAGMDFIIKEIRVME